MKHESHYLPVEHPHPDDWHRHSRAEGAPQAEHAAIASPAVLFRVFVAMVVTVIVVVWLLVVYFHRFTVNMKAERMETTSLGTDARQLKADTNSTLTGYGWSNAAPGSVHVPIDVAAQKVIEQYGALKGALKGVPQSTPKEK